MRLPVAVLAEHQGVGAAEDGGGSGIAGVAEQEASVLSEELVGGVDLAVACQAELSGVSSAVEDSGGFSTVVAEPPSITLTLTLSMPLAPHHHRCSGSWCTFSM